VSLLAGMSELSCLGLFYWDELRSLRFLSTLPLAASLTELHVVGCVALPLSELEHVYDLKRLSELVLRDAFDAPLPVDELQQLASWSCPQLPLLCRFVHD